MKTNLFIAIAIAVCCSACNNGTTTTTENHMDSTSVSATKTDTTMKKDTSMANMDHGKMDDGQFLSMAYTISWFETEAAKLAKTNGSDAKVKSFATKMTADHTAMTKDITELAKKKNVTLPTDLDQAHKDKWAKLNGLKGKDFDKEYAGMMVKGHTECIEHFETAAKEDHSAEVKELITKSLPTLNEHKKLAEDMQTKVDAAK